MSIKTELNKTAEYLRRTRKAILGRGGEISETAGLKDLPDAIINIPADTSLAFQTDEETAYEKVVPSGAEEYALLKSVGGISYKCNNLLPYPYYRNSHSMYGITWQANEDGGITVSGTSTGYSTFDLTNTLPKLTNGKSYIVSGNSSNVSIIFCYKDDSGATQWKESSFEWKSTYTCVSFYLQVATGKTVNETIYPMLNEGTTALPYEPYFEGLRHTAVTAIESEGANLFDDVSFFAQNGWEKQSNGYYLTSNKHTLIFTNTNKISGSISISYSGKVITSVSSGTCLVFAIKYTDGTTAFIGALRSTDTIYTAVSSATDASKTVDTIHYSVGVAYTAEIKDVMINFGTTSAPYKPYSAEPIDTFPIPEAVQSLEGYGLGVEGYGSNEVDFSGKKYIRECYSCIILGNENWYKHASLPIFYCVSLFNRPSNGTNMCLCNAYKGTNKWWTEVANGQITNNMTKYSGVAIHDSRFSTVEEWKAHLAELYVNGNPVTVIYVADEPTEIDISELLTEDNFIKVEGGGVIRAVNEHKQDTPSNIKYTVKVGS